MSEATTTDNPTNDLAQWKEQRQAFRIHALLYAVCMPMMLAINLMINVGSGTTGDIWSWWSLWALIGWTTAIALHGGVVYLAKPEAAANA